MPSNLALSNLALGFLAYLKKSKPFRPPGLDYASPQVRRPHGTIFETANAPRRCASAARTRNSMPVAPAHFVLGTPMVGPFPSSLETIQFGMGCFWGAERVFGRLTEFLVPQLAMQEASPKTPVTRKCVVAVPVILKLSWSSTIQLRFH